MNWLMEIDIPGLSIAGLPDSLGLVIAILSFLVVLGIIWFVVKTVFKLAMRIFWAGCLMIFCLGSFLVIAAFLATGG